MNSPDAFMLLFVAVIPLVLIANHMIRVTRKDLY